MKKRFLSEPVAVACIYLLFVLVLVAFFLFLNDARTNATPQAPPAQTTRTAAGTTRPAGAVAAGDATPQTTAVPTWTYDTPPPAAFALPADGEWETAIAPDWDALRAEADRILAEFGLEVTVSERPEFYGAYHATAYCCEEYPHICGGNGVTASGTVPRQGLTCASDWAELPPGTWLYIEGVGIRRVEDSGSAILGKRLDIAVDTHDNALRWAGFGSHDVWVLSWPAEA